MSAATEWQEKLRELRSRASGPPLRPDGTARPRLEGNSVVIRIDELSELVEAALRLEQVEANLRKVVAQ